MKNLNRLAALILAITLPLQAGAQEMLTELNSKTIKDVTLEADFIVAGGGLAEYALQFQLQGTGRQSSWFRTGLCSAETLPARCEWA